MIIAVEDALSEAVAKKTLSSVGIMVTRALGWRGNQYLKSKARELNRAASNQSVLILTDLDVVTRCPAKMRDGWLGAPPSARLLFRVAVLEIEAWLLADREAFADFAGISSGKIPLEPDAILDPKRALVNLCRHSKSKLVRTGIVPAPGSTAVVGPDYNAQLIGFVMRRWDPTVASQASPSLARTLRRAREHVAKFPDPKN